MFSTVLIGQEMNKILMQQVYICGKPGLLQWKPVCS